MYIRNMVPISFLNLVTVKKAAFWWTVAKVSDKPATSIFRTEHSHRYVGLDLPVYTASLSKIR
jgi:hypothetical protein